MMVSKYATPQPDYSTLVGKKPLKDTIQTFAHQCSVNIEQIEDIYPCSPLQYGLFAASTKSTGSYTAQHCFRLNETVDLAALKRAWNVVIQNNPIIRTCIVFTASGAAQVVLKSWTPSWSDCSVLDSYLRDDLKSPFEAGDVLSRFAISQGHIIWTAHHAIYDAISLEIIIQDVIAAYNHRAMPPRKPYRSFIRYITAQNKNNSVEDFWQKLPSDSDISPFPQPLNKSQFSCDNTCQRRATLPPCSALKVTAATILQAAWALVISSQLSTSKPSWGTTLSGRNVNIPGIEQVVGPTVATVPVCICLDERSTISEYLQTVQKYFIDLAPYQHFGLQNIKLAGAGAEAACNFRNLFVVQPPQVTLIEESVATPMRLMNEAVPAEFFNYPLVTQCFLSNTGEFGITASFDSNFFTMASMSRVLAQFEHICREVLNARTDQRLEDLNFVGGEEMEQFLSWSAPTNRSPGFPLDEIERHCRTRGDAEAVCSWDGKMTYTQLDVLSSHLAERLIANFSLGVGAIVPICVEKSLLLIVSIIATLKAGAAFCLLDPTYPRQRLLDIIEQTGAKTVLSSTINKELFSSSTGRIAVVSDLCTPLEQDHRVPERPNSVSLSVENAMYLVFTSGSTGKPKGVIVSHGSFFSSALAGEFSHIPRYQLNTESRTLHFSSPAFDLCVLEIISTLMAGGCVCVPSENDRLSDMGTVIRSMNVNHASFTSTAARFIKPNQVPTLKTLGLVGEPLAKDVQQLWADKVCLLNAYGPSECSVISTVHHGVTKTTDPANIGHIVAGTGWIVHPDNHNRLVPIGTTGELVIDGPHVARGYLNDSAATKAAFIDNPVWLDPERFGIRRMYKTGDLVRYDTDGSLIFDGRKDQQVKLHGQRIEIGEIEFHLASLFPNASGVAVELLKHDNYQQLVCFIFGGNDSQPAQHENSLSLLSNQDIQNTLDIRSHLLRVVPRHFIPSRYILWSQPPTLSSGKLDRKKLRQESNAPSGLAFELPQPEVQLSALRHDDVIAQQLRQEVVKLLGARETPNVRISEGHDIFLSHLNLDSIQLITLINYCRSHFNVKLSIETLYSESLTIAGLGQLIRDHKDQTNTINQPSIEVIDLMHEIDKASRTLVPILEHGSRTVFLTGASGYLGSEILRQLVQDDTAKKLIIHIRASSTENAIERIISAARLGKWWSPTYLKRIECWLGDLSLPQLGLSPQQWQMLKGDCEPDLRIDDVILCGAAVQWQAPYTALQATNVQSTVEVLGAISQWHHGGSVTYVSGGVKRLPHQDAISFADTLKMANGYSQTKFVAEELVARFAESQHASRINTSIIRPGWIIGTDAEGVPNTDDFLWKLVQTCVAVNAYPNEYEDSWLAVASVDEVARNVLDAVLGNREVPGGHFHVTDINTGMRVETFWKIVRKTLGTKVLRPVTYSECRAEIAHLMDKTGETHSFGPFMAMIEEGSHQVGIDLPLRYREQSDQTEQALGRNLRTLKAIGFFEGAWASPASQVKLHQPAQEGEQGAFHRSKFMPGRQNS